MVDIWTYKAKGKWVANTEELSEEFLRELCINVLGKRDTDEDLTKTDNAGADYPKEQEQT